MRPTLVRGVIYVRAVGEEYAATITRVSERPIADDGLEMAAAACRMTAPEYRFARFHDEHTYDVHLAVDIHTDARAERWFTMTPVAYDGREIPAANTWHWLPRD